MSNAIEHKHIQRILNGETDVFKHLVREHQGLAFSIAMSMVKDEIDAKDVVQNAFVQAFKSLKSFKADSQFSTWLYKIVVNESLKFLSKNKRWGNYKSMPIENEDTSVTFNEAMINLDLAEKKEEIRKVLLKMKPKEALILKLFYLQEFSLIEMQEITGFQKSNIKVLLFRGRKSFMKYYLKLNPRSNEGK